ncbi:Hypothetical predicted protein [Olea europaea subsp. europaea]|uniref:Uncharacterized protein n=1 Tax=Olea europaea subsp. europaea TaxID=158383 RepID=A0A8S0RBF5_OLEEU|nr:Hypothetical predicted protein [Olea europaea subsp. europaea]
MVGAFLGKLKVVPSPNLPAPKVQSAEQRLIWGLDTGVGPLPVPASVRTECSVVCRCAPIRNTRGGRSQTPAAPGCAGQPAVLVPPQGHQHLSPEWPGPSTGTRRGNDTPTAHAYTHWPYLKRVLDWMLDGIIISVSDEMSQLRTYFTSQLMEGEFEASHRVRRGRKFPGGLRGENVLCKCPLATQPGPCTSPDFVRNGIICGDCGRAVPRRLRACQRGRADGRRIGVVGSGRNAPAAMVASRRTGRKNLM